MSRRRLITLLGFSALIPISPYLYSRFLSPHVRTIFARPHTMDGVIIVGSGLAGLSAASELVSREVPVYMLERALKPGGNSMKASSGINGAPTRFQSGPADTTFYADTFKSAGSALSTYREEREQLISALTSDSKSAVEWLVDQQGVDLSRVAILGGHSHPRTHRPSGQMPVGASIVTTLLKNLQANPLFHLQTESTAIKIKKSESGEVNGVEYTTTEEGAEAKSLNGPVIFATGGFAGDADGLLKKYRPDLAGYPSTNTPAPGSAPLLTAAGAQLLDMDLVQVHPTGFIDPKDTENKLKFLAAEVLRGEGGILLTAEGHRFYNELETRTNVTDAIIKNTKEPENGNPTPGSTRQFPVYIVLDEATYEAAKSHLDFYIWKGLVRKTTISDLPPDALSAIKEYSNTVAAGSTDSFGRSSFGHWALKEPTEDSVIYVGSVTPVVHFTMGGVHIDVHSAVLGEAGSPIPGLWAAGEAAGGVHGGNRLGGNSLLECTVFGRRAGQAAAEYYSGKKA